MYGSHGNSGHPLDPPLTIAKTILNNMLLQLYNIIYFLVRFCYSVCNLTSPFHGPPTLPFRVARPYNWTMVGLIKIPPLVESVHRVAYI